MPLRSAPGAASQPDASLDAVIAPIVARPPQHPASFAATELLCDSAGYQDWLLVIRSRLPADVLRYLRSGEPCASWPPSLVPLWDHYALSSLCSSVDPRLVLPGLSTFLGDSDGAPKIWHALRSRYGATSAVDLHPAVVTLFSTKELPATTGSFLQFRNGFENQLRLLTSSKVTVDSLVASHLLSRLPPSLESWRSTFVNDQGDSTTLPSVSVIFDRLLRDIRACPVDAPTAALARSSARDTRPSRFPCPNPKCRKMHWLRDCPDTAWAASFRARRAIENGNKPTVERRSSQPAASPAVAPSVAAEHLSPAIYSACFLSASFPFDKGAWLLDSGANRHMANDVRSHDGLQVRKETNVVGHVPICAGVQEPRRVIEIPRMSIEEARGRLPIDGEADND